MDIGKLIKEYRAKNNLTQTSFGKIVGVNKQTVSKWENGTMQPSMEKFFEIAAAIKIPVDNLLKDENKNELFVYTHKTKYNVGLNCMYQSVHNFDSFCAFIDAMGSAHELLEPNSHVMGFLLIGITCLDERSNDKAIPINFIYWDSEDIVIDIPEHTLRLTDENTLRIDKVASFNNEAYIFNVYLKAKQDTFIQIALLLDTDTEDR